MQDYFDQISSSRRRRRGRAVERRGKKFKSQRSLLKKKRRRRCDASARVLLCGCVNTMAFFLTTDTGVSAQRPARLSSGGGGGFQVMYACKSSQRTHGENKPVRGNQLRWQTQVQPPPTTFNSWPQSWRASRRPQRDASEVGFRFLLLMMATKAKEKRKGKKTLGGGVCTPPHAPVCGPGPVLPSDSWWWMA